MNVFKVTLAGTRMSPF